MIQPRFLDTVEIAAPIRQNDMPPEVATTLTDTNASIGGGSNMRGAKEQVKNFTYWQYIAIRRIADFASHIVPNFSVPIRKSADMQHLSARDRNHLRERYGWLQSMHDDLQPLDDQHPICELFRTVNPDDSYCEFIYETILFWCLTGRFYWWAIPNGLGRPVQLWVIPSQSAEEQFDRNGRFVGVKIAETQREIPADQIIRGKFKSPLSKRDSYSEMQAAPFWVNNVEAIAKSRQRSFDQGINPDLLLHLEGDRYQNPQPDELTRIREKFLLRSAGVNNHGEPLLVPPGIRAEPWSRDPKDMDYAKGSEQARDENLALYGVPKTVAGITDEVTRANFDGSLVAFCNIRMNPMLSQLAGIITEKLVPKFDSRIRCWFPDCTPASAERELAEDKLDLEYGAMSPDERRSKRGREPNGTAAYQSGYMAAGRVPLDEELNDDPVDDGKPAKGKGDDDSGTQSILRHGGERGNGHTADPFPRFTIRQGKAEKRRRRVSRQFAKLNARLERRFIQRQRPFWATLTDSVLRRLSDAGTVAVDVDEIFAAAEFRDGFNAAMLPEWNRAVYAGIDFEMQWIESAEVQSIRAVAQDVDPVDIDNPVPPPSIRVDPSPALQGEVRGFLKERAVGVWNRVGTTTHDRLRRAISRGLNDGDDLAGMSARIREILKSQSKYGARRIARTETTGSMNFGQQAEREDIGIEEKEWVTTIDARARGAKPGEQFNHLAADGQVAKQSEAFTVSGEQLLFPADGSRGASAGNIIHCRCTAVAHIE